MTSYDPEATLKAWNRYVKVGIGAEDFLNRLEGYISTRAGREATRRGLLSTLQNEEAVQRVRGRVWDAIKRKRIPGASSREFHSYLLSIIHREIGSYLAEERRVKEFPPECMHAIARRALNTSEDRVFLEELPDALRKRVCGRMSKRFPDVEPMASKFVIDRVFNGEYTSHHWLSYQYHVEVPRFFIESVIIALRMEVYEMAGDVVPVSSLLRETLYGSYMEGYFDR